MSTATKRLPRTRDGNMIGLTDAVTAYWVERLLTTNPGADSQRRNSLSYSNDSLCHYGHWTLARGIRDKRGRTRLVLINADRWAGASGFGPSTDSRRAAAESEVRKAGLPYLLVPFSAMGAAGIRADSIRVLEMCEETWTVSLHREKVAKVHRDAEQNYSRYTRDGDTVTVRDERHGYMADVRWTLERDGDSYLLPAFRHWLGEALFHADVHERGVERPRRRVKFLSAFDHNEPGMSYFLCELPRCEAKTVQQAFDVLAPAPVKAAQAAGLAVERQGDIFAIPTSLTTRELKSRAAEQTVRRYEIVATRSWRAGEPPTEDTQSPLWDHVLYPVKSLRMAPLLATNHVATEQVRTTDGDVYARGFLRHRPDFRDPDHRQIKLGDGKTWYRVVKNTVPVAKAPMRNSRMFNVQQSGQARAWTLGGAVD